MKLYNTWSLTDLIGVEVIRMPVFSLEIIAVDVSECSLWATCIWGEVIELECEIISVGFYDYEIFEYFGLF